jgi:tRNA1(Val) A37 N6-methylase TrmN6
LIAVKSIIDEPLSVPDVPVYDWAMSETKTRRIRKRQLGQFYTPADLAQQIIADLPLTPKSMVLEPSAGNGAFVLALVARFMALHRGTRAERLRRALGENIVAVEIDRAAYDAMLAAIDERWGPLPAAHRLVHGDFFATSFGDAGGFDFIVGNPPFGGTIDPRIQDQLDGCYGQRDGLKIKKETYSFFIVRSAELLRPGGRLCFICSDTFLTIPTMKGLREFLLNRGRTAIATLSQRFEETAQPMVLLDFARTGRTDSLRIDETIVHRDTINLTGNCSWGITAALAPLFAGPKLGDLMVASSGMTIGRNDLFVREIVDGSILEPFEFHFRDEPVTLRGELERARLGRLSPARRARIAAEERRGATRRTVEAVPRVVPRRVQLAHPDYFFYNKSTSAIVYAPPRHAIFWRDEGDAVITFKKTGNWYLHGVGGMPYFKREGLTWQLIAPTLNARFLPPGYILDSGAPCAFLREGIERDELWFVLGWCLTPLCTRVLKDVLNHTRNIQSKDVERLPYPFWVSAERKGQAIRACRALVDVAMRSGCRIGRTDAEVVHLVGCYTTSAIHASGGYGRPGWPG